MATNFESIEFSEDLSSKKFGNSALEQFLFYRLSVKEGEIPFFEGGLPLLDFTVASDVVSAVSHVLPEFVFTVDVESKRVSIGEISVLI